MGASGSHLLSLHHIFLDYRLYTDILETSVEYYVAKDVRLGEIGVFGMTGKFWPLVGLGELIIVEPVGIKGECHGVILGNLDDTARSLGPLACHNFLEGGKEAQIRLSWTVNNSLSFRPGL